MWSRNETFKLSSMSTQRDSSCWQCKGPRRPCFRRSRSSCAVAKYTLLKAIGTTKMVNSDNMLEGKKNKPMWKPQQQRWTSTSKPLQKWSPLSKVKVQNIKRKHHLEPLSGDLKTSGGTFEFQTFMSSLNIEQCLPETFEPLCSTCIWNLCVEPASGTGELLRVEHVCGTLGNLHLCENF